MSDVPKGYRMSEVGVIPEEWEVKELGEILKVKHGKSQHEIIDVNGAFPILATGGVIGWTNVFLYDEPSVLIGRKGTIDVPQYMESPFWTIDTLFYTEIFKNTFPKFIFYKFNTIDWYSFNEASGVPSLNAKTIEKIQIPLPPLPEQQAIASALSDADALIAALEQFITKKRNIKQGAMQQLLTGEKRLPGFEGEWEVKTFNKIADVRDGTHESPKYHENGVIFITSKNIIDGNIDFTDINFISEDDATNINQRSKVDKGDILMSMIGTIGNAVLINFEPNFCIKNVALIKPSKVSGNYLIKFLQSQVFQKCLNENLDGGIQKFISLGRLRELNIPIPFPAEQQAIAQILSDMDAEIEYLEQKQAKYKAIKQGMMQELLTGKTRLV